MSERTRLDEIVDRFFCDVGRYVDPAIIKGLASAACEEAFRHGVERVKEQTVCCPRQNHLHIHEKDFLVQPAPEEKHERRSGQDKRKP